MYGIDYTQEEVGVRVDALELLEGAALDGPVGSTLPLVSIGGYADLLFFGLDVSRDQGVQAEFSGAQVNLISMDGNYGYQIEFANKTTAGQRLNLVSSPAYCAKCGVKL